ncbi:uncharacterized [Tachysurus ichikawai]
MPGSLVFTCPTFTGRFTDCSSTKCVIVKLVNFIFFLYRTLLLLQGAVIIKGLEVNRVKQNKRRGEEKNIRSATRPTTNK